MLDTVNAPLSAAILDAIETRPRAIESDADLVGAWLHGRPRNTVRAYAAEIARLEAFLGGLPLAEASILDLQHYMDTRALDAPATYNRAVTALQGLWSFGVGIGHLRADVAAQLRRKPAPNRLAERIVKEEDVLRAIDREPDPRNRLLVRLVYAAGLRCEEAAGLAWHQVAEGTGGRLQLTVMGKGGKTRAVRLSAATSDLLRAWRPEGAEGAVFPSRKGGGHLDVRQVRRVVVDALEAVGVEGQSTHSLRHSHASHALDRGASLVTVRDTLGHASIATTNAYLHARPGASSADSLPV